MPLHDHVCLNGHRFERRIAINELDVEQRCPECDAVAQRTFFKFPMAFVQADILYDSPIDGRVIRTKQERIEDLARAGCVEYDPGMRADADRRRKQSEARLEKLVDETVEAEFEAMPSRKKEKLAAELEGGMTAEPVRVTAPAQPITTEIAHG